MVADNLRLHPRIAYQGLCADDVAARSIANSLRPLTPFRNDYAGAICVLDWDHRLPSKMLALRVYAYYSDESWAAGQEAYDDRLEEIGNSDRYPEFDVTDNDLIEKVADNRPLTASVGEAARKLGEPLPARDVAKALHREAEVGLRPCASCCRDTTARGRRRLRRPHRGRHRSRAA